MFSPYQKSSYGGIIINPGCSLSCVFCGGCKKNFFLNLKEEEFKVLLNLKWLRKNGFQKIAISGSDPIEYNYLPELIKYIKNSGFNTVHLATHGIRLANDNFLKKLVLSGLNEIKVPIYGSSPTIHDVVTQTTGSFNMIIRGLLNLKKIAPQIKIQIATLILRQNQSDLFKIIRLVNKIGVSKYYISIPCLEEDDISFYVPFKKLPFYVKKIYNFALKFKTPFEFLEIPFCVLGKLDLKHIKNQVGPPDLGKYNQPPLSVRTSISSLPSYRLKIKPKMCLDCRAFDFCDGFFINDIIFFGTGKLKPLK